MTAMTPDYNFSEFKNFMNEKTDIMNRITHIINELHAKYGGSIIVVSVADIRSGVINSADLLKIRQHLLGINKLNGPYFLIYFKAIGPRPPNDQLFVNTCTGSFIIVLTVSSKSVTLLNIWNHPVVPASEATVLTASATLLAIS